MNLSLEAMKRDIGEAKCFVLRAPLVGPDPANNYILECSFCESPVGTFSLPPALSQFAHLGLWITSSIVLLYQTDVPFKN